MLYFCKNSQLVKLAIELPKIWNIPKDLERSFGIEKIEETLNLFNCAGDNHYIVMDYFRQKIITGTPSCATLTGYSREVIQKDGFSFYRRILEKSEMDWLIKLITARHELFFSYPEYRRKDLSLSFDLTTKNANQTELVLRHKLVPYQLCKNGNLWLELCFVTETAFEHTPKAIAVDSQTGRQYDFINGAFKLSDIKILSQEELNILRWMTKDLSAKQICEHLGIADSSLKRKKRKIYETLGVSTSAGAVYKAHLIGII